MYVLWHFLGGRYVTPLGITTQYCRIGYHEDYCVALYRHVTLQETHRFNYQSSVKRSYVEPPTDLHVAIWTFLVCHDILYGSIFHVRRCRSYHVLELK